MISIIIPTYNRAKIITRAIDSVLSQTAKNWQLIIVDDGSTDDTETVISRYHDPRIRYIKKSNSGASHSRNVGALNAQGDYLMFLDSDDEAKPQWLESFETEIAKGYQIITCGYDTVDENGQKMSTVIPKRNASQSVGRFMAGSYLLSTQMFRELEGFDENIPSSQHTELYFRLKKYIADTRLQTSIIYESLFKVHYHKGNRISTNHRAKYEGSLYIYNKHQRVLKDWTHARSQYEGVIAYHAYRLGRKREALLFAFKAAKSEPTMKKILRIFRYLIPGKK